MSLAEQCDQDRKQDILARYAEIASVVERIEQGIPLLREAMTGLDIAYEKARGFEKIAEIVNRKEDEKEGETAGTTELQVNPENEEIPAWEVLNKVFEEICHCGEIERSFKASILIGRDEDWHRVDECHLEGEGRVLVTSKGKAVLALGRPTSHLSLAGGVERGIVFTKLEGNNADDHTLNRLLTDSFEKGQGLFKMEGGMLFFGMEAVPLDYALGVGRSKTAFRGRSGMIFGDDKEIPEVPDGLVPIATVKGYKKDVIPFLVRQIKDNLGISEHSTSQEK